MSFQDESTRMTNQERLPLFPLILRPQAPALTDFEVRAVESMLGMPFQRGPNRYYSHLEGSLELVVGPAVMRGSSRSLPGFSCIRGRRKKNSRYPLQHISPIDFLQHSFWQGKPLHFSPGDFKGFGCGKIFPISFQIRGPTQEGSTHITAGEDEVIGGI